MVTGPMSAQDGFAVDPQRLQAGAAEFDTFAERARALARGLADELDDTGTPWGTDAVGDSFAAVHVGPANRTRELVEGLAGALAEFGEALAEAAAAYDAADADAAEAVREPGRTR
ncbi:hypothetical protein MINT15_21820 [Saccharomonospora viridis]|uniref:Excreted virulence factor EspC, type VII ESX diderm n=3 Tax=Saccharomonospora viridis TaxID=1852 RepID=C7MUV2_SACVD|nr:hypothetical protein Svir_05940 [Saccharomonospora viridis DSM 43017]KHF43877.1 hypothetical protein MINT15_21820 [Saccharomonospora viridis]